MGLKRTVAPTLPLVTLAEAKAHCQVDHNDDDTLIEALIAGWSAWLDGYSGVMGMALAPQTYEWTLDGFPFGALRLPIGPLISVSSISYVDADGVTQVVPSDVYQVDDSDCEAFISPAAGWPTSGSAPNAVKVTFVAGWPSAACPDSIKLALKFLVSASYESRNAETGGSFDAVPFVVRSLLTAHRRMSV